MRKVIYMTSISVDGYIEAARGDPSWMFPDEQLHRHFNELESSIDTHLYGRRMYELMAAYWPTADEKPSAPAYEVEYARIWKSVPKIVFSRTLHRVDWNSRLVKGDALEEVARLKEHPGKDMSIGGAGLASTLGEGGLIDEYRLYIVPIILGGGKPMFRELCDRINLSLVEVQRFASDVVLLRYRRLPLVTCYPSLAGGLSDGHPDYDCITTDVTGAIVSGSFGCRTYVSPSPEGHMICKWS
jgi:dihydrofolate reductase